MDVVYYVRAGERNDELRYSLRSLVNLPHDRVWIVGHKPAWVTGVDYVRGNGHATPWANAVANLRIACELGPQRFTVMNDDFYIMEPLTDVPAWHDGPLAERITTASSGYRRQLKAAQVRLPADATAWTLHIPLVVDRDPLADVLASLTGSMPPEWRTMYGNLTGQQGERVPDVKVRKRSDPLPAGPFLSTSDATFAHVLPLLRERFPQPSPYEVTP